ncbi:hypothetical protein FOA52_004183 [Chlamydomonas sp. UWO 241]|nr:hypothetical protein FOA52_004183 [Chlamydomonas sp. UWO 241]
MFLDKSTLMGGTLQVVIGILLTVGVYMLAFAILYMDVKNTFVTSNTRMTEIVVLDGYADSSQLAVTSFNTVLQFAKNYLPITHSVNMKGGAQFSYSLWLNIQNPDDPSILNKCIFMRGDKKKYTYEVYDHVTGDGGEVIDYMTYCPMLSFGTNKLDFSVKFNTANKLDQEMYVARIESSNDVFRRNILSVLQKNWIMITLVFEDNIPINDFENGVRVQMYVNELLYDSNVYAGMLKQNMGNLEFFPDGPAVGVRLSAMKYFNYALSSVDIGKMFVAGPVLAPGTTTTTTVAHAAYSGIDASTGNILDVYNI